MLTLEAKRYYVSHFNKLKNNNIPKADDFRPNTASNTEDIIVTGQSIGQPIKSKRTLLTICGILVLGIIVGVIAAAISLQAGKKEVISQNPSPKICDDVTLIRAADSINTNDTNSLERLVKQIESNGKYISDPNCLYVTTFYYIAIVDLAKARENHDNLRLVYISKDGFSNKLGPFAKNIKFFDSEIKRLEKVVEEFKKNTFTGPKAE